MSLLGRAKVYAGNFAADVLSQSFCRYLRSLALSHHHQSPADAAANSNRWARRDMAGDMARLVIGPPHPTLPNFLALVPSPISPRKHHLQTPNLTRVMRQLNTIITHCIQYGPPPPFRHAPGPNIYARACARECTHAPCERKTVG